jgi:hypothetical protein
MRRESAATLRVQRLDAAECHEIIRREVRGRKTGKLHAAVYDWRALVDQGLEAAPANDAKE